MDVTIKDYLERLASGEASAQGLSTLVGALATSLGQVVAQSQEDFQEEAGQLQDNVRDLLDLVEKSEELASSETAANPQIQALKALNNTVKILSRLVEAQLEGDVVFDLATATLLAQTALQAVHLSAIQKIQKMQNPSIQQTVLNEANQLLTEGTGLASGSFQLAALYINNGQWPDLEGGQ